MGPMRAAAFFACAILLSSTALAQSKGGPSLDPLGDRTHNEPDTSQHENNAGRRVQKVRVKKRTVRVTKTGTTAPALKPVTPPKNKAVAPKKALAPRKPAAKKP